MARRFALHERMCIHTCTARCEESNASWRAPCIVASMSMPSDTEAPSNSSDRSPSDSNLSDRSVSVRSMSNRTVSDLPLPAHSPSVPDLFAVKAVVFDIDDTICDSAGAFATGIRLVVDRYMPGLPEPQVQRAIEIWRADPNKHYRRYTRGECTFDEQRFARANELNEEFGGPQITWDEYLNEWKPLFWNAFCSHWKAHPDVRPCLDLLESHGFRLGALSNASAELQTRKLMACGCVDDVPLLVTMDTFGFGKPDPRVFQEAAHRLELLPDEVAYVGDEFDIDAQAACKAGLHGFWIDRPSRHLDSRSEQLPVDVSGSPDESAQQVIRVESLTQMAQMLVELHR